ncbi:hypothetical protein GQ457_11G023210 [Hibiscus cannabinus]
MYQENQNQNAGQHAAGQNNQPADENAGAFERPRAIRDHLTPILDDLNPRIVAPEIQAAHFELKPVMFNMLNSIGQFGGSPHEDARQHIRAFLKLKLFPYSLRDRARAANPTTLEYQFEPEIQRVCRRNRKESRSMADPPNNRNAANNNQIAAAGGGNPPLAIPHIQVQNRSIRDHLLPDLGNLNPGIVTPEIQAAQFELKPVMFNMLNSIGQFGGSPHEDARQHLRSFIEVCDSFRQQGVHEDILRLKLFPYSLRDRARLWFNSIPSGSVESWDDLCRDFIIRYSSTVMTDKLRNDITSFRQTDDESMYKAWDRYKELFRKCPMHGFNEWTKVIMFYNGVNAPTRMMLDASANGTLLDKSAEEAIEILNRLANNDYQFPSTRRGMARRNGTTYELEPTDFNPESSFYVGNFNRNNNPYSNTYNPGWKQHPNFSWSNQRNPSNTIRQNAEASGFQQNISQQQNQLPQQQPSSTSSLENSLNAFIHKTESYMADTTKFMGRTDSFINMTEIQMQSQEAALKSLETQVGQFAQMLSARPQGNLPSNTEVARGTGHEQCKVITTRSGVKTTNETIQDEENESPKVTETNLYGTSTQEDAIASPNVAASSSHNAKSDEVSKGKEIHLPPPFPQRLRKQKYEYQFKKFLDILKQVHINLSLVEEIEQIPNYAKFLKDMVSKRTRLSEFETVAMTEGCMAMLHNRLPPKLKDPGSFTIPCAIGNHYVGKALCDLGASINLMPKSVFQRLGIGKARPTTVMLQLADQSYVHPEGKIEDILVRVDKFIFPADFIVLDCEADEHAPIILGRPFLATGRMLIDYEKGELTIRVNDQQVRVNIFKSLKQPDYSEECQTISAVSKFNFEVDDVDLDKILVEASKIKEAEFKDDEPQKVNWIVNRPCMNFESLDLSSTSFKPNKPFIEQPPVLELKPLPEQLKYVYLGNDDTLPVIISSKIQHEQEKQLINMLARHKKAIGWTIADIKGISPAICSHKILLEEGHNNSIEAERRLNPAMKQVVMKEIIKWLDVGIIFPISDSAWVSPVQCVPKKGGMTMVSNEKNELIPTRTVTSWRVCMDYRKLNKATRKDHFPLPFIDQMLDRLAGKSFYCFLDGYSGYNQIAIAQEDQEKTTFTCPFGTYAFRRMPFGLCNAPATFQRCMMAIFSDMVEDFLEIFMDDFSVFGDNFDTCLSNLEKVLTRCEETDLVLNWEKCHFMVDQGIVLGHKISSKGIEVDKAKVDVIAKLPPPNSVKGVRSFLGHAGFYRRFIQNFSKISKPLCNLLEQDKVFNFDESCAKAFEDLKKQLASAPIVHSPDWSLPFELMCDASDFAVGAVLGQREGKVFHVVYYASKTLNDAQLNYTTTEKELLAVVFAFEKFRPYLIGTKVIVHTDHSAIKYLLPKKDAKPRLIRWILLLQEFDVEIKDRKGTENQIADHVSRLEGGDAHDNHFEIHDKFPDEKLLLAVATPWYADIVNFLVSGILPYDLTYQGKKRFLHNAKHYYWDEPLLFKNVQIRSYEGVFPKMNNKMYSYNVIHHPMEVILEAHTQRPKFYNQAFIGRPFLKIPITSTRGVIDAKEQGISQDDMRCHCRIYLRLSCSTFGG